MKAAILKIVAILMGSSLLAVGIDFFLVPFKILDGGVLGIALIINYLFGANVGLVMFSCSIPIIILAAWYYRSMPYNSVHGLIVSSLFIDLLWPYHYHFLYYVELTPFSSSVIGGFIIGTGIGIMLRYETSTGGLDLLAQLLSKMVTLNVGILVFALDGIIICVGGLLLSAETFILSIFTITSGGVATSLFTMKGR